MTSTAPPADAITRYRVEMDNGNNGNYASVFSLVPSGNEAEFIHAISANITAGLGYRVRIVAANVNGEGAPSSPLTIYACEPASGLSRI